MCARSILLQVLVRKLAPRKATSTRRLLCCMSQELARTPRLLRCSDSVWLQSYFHRPTSPSACLLVTHSGTPGCDGAPGYGHSKLSTGGVVIFPAAPLCAGRRNSARHPLGA